MTLHDVALDDKFDLTKGRIFVSGAQAVVRMLMMQRELDRRMGFSTAGFVTGYRGSPLGALDYQLWRAKKHLAASRIEFSPGLNEDLGATMVWGSQLASVDKRTPAATLTRSLPPSAVRIASSSSRSCMRWGLNATRTRSASRHADALSVVARTPWRSARRLATSLRRAVTMMRSGGSSPARNKPAKMASPIVPQPRIARVCSRPPMSAE